jgi:low affinity Fe/Cu permease
MHCNDLSIPMKNNKTTVKKAKSAFDRFSTKVAKATGSPYAALGAFLLILVWIITGPLFGYSDTWQLIINTTTTIVTFLMVFIIQQSQNKDTMAIQLKLNELIAATKGASNHLIDVEDLTEKELETIKKFYIKLSELADKEDDVLSTHSFSEAEEIHQGKVKIKRPAKTKTTS